MAEKLSEKIKLTLQRYYTNRANQSVMDFKDGVLKERGWNKEEDLDVIFQAAREEGWSTSAVAGTFWFSKKVVGGLRHIIEVNEETLPQGGKSNIRDAKESYGALGMIAETLEKIGKQPFFIRKEEDADAYAHAERERLQGEGEQG